MRCRQNAEMTAKVVHSGRKSRVRLPSTLARRLQLVSHHFTTGRLPS
jgi:hypothetical protein